MNQKGLAPIRLERWECAVCRLRFESKEQAWAEFSPPDPFPEGTRVRLRGYRSVGTVVKSEVLTDPQHKQHRRVISVDYGRGVRNFYIYQDEDQSNQIEAE